MGDNEHPQWEKALRELMLAIPLTVKNSEISRIISECRRSRTCLVCLPGSTSTHLTGRLTDYAFQALQNPQMPLKYALSTYRGLLCNACLSTFAVEKRCHQEKQLKDQQYLEEQRQQVQARFDKRYKAFEKGYGTPANDFYLLDEIIRPEEREDLQAMAYRNFLNTRFWQVVRRYALWKYDNKCFLCPSQSSLNVHHRTYKFRGYEDLHWKESLVVLCHPCHARHHDKLAQLPQE